MSRSGYVDDDDDVLALGRYRGRVASAIRGKRGQRLLRECLAALDAMPVKELIADELVADDGGVCLLGAVAQEFHLPIGNLDPEAHDVLGKTFNVAECLIREIEYQNDEGGWRETPEQRWNRVRRWVVAKLKPQEAETAR